MIADQKLSRRSSLLPDIVVATIDYIDAHGMKVEGIFRVNGDLKAAETILEQYKSGRRVDLRSELGSAPNDATCRTVASLLKMYFRTLPDPLFPYPIYKSVLRYCRKPEKLKEVITSAMSQSSRDALEAILRLCERISSHGKENMMHASALSICWGASLIKAPPSTDDSMFAVAMYVTFYTLFFFFLCMFIHTHAHAHTGIWKTEQGDRDIDFKSRKSVSSYIFTGIHIYNDTVASSNTAAAATFCTTSQASSQASGVIGFRYSAVGVGAVQ